MSNQYTAEYFIAKFSAIPDEQWCTDNFTKKPADGPIQHCAMGHLGMRNDSYIGFGPANETAETDALDALLENRTTEINDGESWTTNDGALFTPIGATPKERILNALKWTLEARL